MEHITFNLAYDGVEVFQSSNKGSVYIVSLTINNTQAKHRNTERGTFRISAIPHSSGTFSEPFSRAALGAIIKYINEKGKAGLYIEDNGVLFHVYFSIHAFVADLKAAMQLYDRSNCTNTYQPCITHGCVNASYDVVTRSYVPPERNPCVYQDKMKSVCRSLTHFKASSVWRLFPAVSSYASDVIFPPTEYPNKEDTLFELLQTYMGCSLIPQDKEKVLHMYKFARSLGRSFFMRQNIEVGEYEREPFMMQPFENSEKPFRERRCLVDLAYHSPLPLDAAYGCEYMHALSNITESVNAYLMNKAYINDDTETNIYSSIIYFINNQNECNELTASFFSVPSFVKDGLVSFFGKCNSDMGGLFKKDDCLIPSHFKALNSHTKMIWGFQYFPLLFSQSLHFPVVRLWVYIFMILSELFNLDRDLDEAQKLNHLLNLCYAAVEGITPDSFFTPSMHVPLHSFHSICNSGPLLYTNTFMTERSYQWDKDNNRSSANRMKTAAKRVIINSFLTYNSMIKTLTPHKNTSTLKLVDKTVKRYDSFTIDEVRVITKRNYQDSYVFFRCDLFPFVTGLDLFIHNNHSIPDDLRYDEYFDSSIWNDVNWNSTMKHFKMMTYHNENYYSFNYAYSTSIDHVLSSRKHFAFIRGWDRQIYLFVMLSFFNVTVKDHDFPQCVCYHVKSSPIISCFPGVSILRIAKKDLYHLDTSRLCIINLDRLNHNKGCFCCTSTSDEVYFIPNKLVIKQSRVIKHGDCYLSVPVSKETPFSY